MVKVPIDYVVQFVLRFAVSCCDRGLAIMKCDSLFKDTGESKVAKVDAPNCRTGYHIGCNGSEDYDENQEQPLHIKEDIQRFVGLRPGYRVWLRGVLWT